MVATSNTVALNPRHVAHAAAVAATGGRPASGWKAEHARVPDQRPALSGFRTRNLKSSLLTLALTAPAAALAAVAIGTAGAAPVSAAARPASVTSTVQVAGTSTAVSAGSGAQAATTLDGFARPLSGAARQGASRGAAEQAAAKASTTPRGIARSMLRHFGWWPGQFKDLNWLWERESSWNVRAFNPYSGATGIPQAVPGSKMASAGPNWRTSARTQIRWGLRYIKGRYGSPRRAWHHELDTGWY
jgi:hypothetical protein